MLNQNSFDTICHEHTEYYSLSLINQLLTCAGMKVIDVSFNNVNGGSIAITAALKSSKYSTSFLSNYILDSEAKLDLANPDAPIYQNFIYNTKRFASELHSLFSYFKDSSRTVYGLGASTKGNTILQYAGIDSRLVSSIFEVNDSKYGKVTPGTSIPIIPENLISKIDFDYLFVLPWHFKSNLISNLSRKYDKSMSLIFPLPYPTFVNI